MTGLGEYAYGVIGGGLVCAIIRNLTHKGPYEPIMKLLCGLFFTVSLLHLLSNLNFDEILSVWKVSGIDHEDTVTAIGEEYTRNHLAQCIKSDTEEYILDKAESLGAAVTVQIVLSETDIPVPVGVRISGEVEQNVKDRFAAILETDLNISKENQVWTEGNSAKRE